MELGAQQTEENYQLIWRLHHDRFWEEGYPREWDELSDSLEFEEAYTNYHEDWFVDWENIVDVDPTEHFLSVEEAVKDCL